MRTSRTRQTSNTRQTSRSRRPLWAPWLVAAALLLVTGCAGPTPRQAGAVDPGSSPTVTATPGPRPTASPSLPIDVAPLTVPRSLTRPLTGGDMSWPQCPEGMGIPEKRSLSLPMPLGTASFVVLGLTNGPGFTPNPCLASQVRWAKERHLMAAAYAVNSYPDEETLRRYRAEGPHDGSTRLGALRNVGYQQARYNLGTLRAAGLVTPVVWLDVEPVPVFPWSTDVEANAAVVVGAARGYVDAGYRIGAYSTEALWAAVVGDLRLGVPEWRPAGETSRAEALRRCGADRMFQGGQAILAQWVDGRRGRDITCPGTRRELYRWFHQY